MNNTHEATPIRHKPKKQPSLKSRVSAKMAVGDIKGDINIVVSKESVLPPSNETKARLQEKSYK